MLLGMHFCPFDSLTLKRQTTILSDCKQVNLESSFFLKNEFVERNYFGTLKRLQKSTVVSTCSLRHTGPEYVEDTNTNSNSDSLNSPDQWKSKESLDGATETIWEQMSLTIRVLYALGLYGGLACAGHVICSLTGTDCWGGFNLSRDAVLTGLGCAVPPMVILLCLQDDEVVKAWPPARAVRDVEDGELLEYFDGLGWQFLLVVIAGAVSEELFFRVAVQGGLTRAIQASGKDFNETVEGLSALTALIPSFSPFAQVLGVLLSSALTGSMYYVLSAPKDPTYVLASVPNHSRPALQDIKKRFIVWNERRKMRTIYSPLVESILALYLGLEWVHSGNILAPMITHLIYSNVVVGNGLIRLHYQRTKLRQRVSTITSTKTQIFDNKNNIIL